MQFDVIHTENQLICKEAESRVEIWIKREDMLHSIVSGNKFRKLKYNFQEAEFQDYAGVLTFGGAYSNHISAVAYAARTHSMKAVGIIRGDELGKNLSETLAKNPTLKFAHECGMELQFISRKKYRTKDSEKYRHYITEKYKDFYVIPEGGTNRLAVKGCEETLTGKDNDFDMICCPVGTGGTIAGIINASAEHQRILGFPALKGDFLKTEVAKFTSKQNWDLVNDYHFGGYAKVNVTLVDFMNRFKKAYGIVLDPVYTGKMMFGIFDLLQRGHFRENTRILAVHTGGLQGISGMNKFLQKRNMALIEE